ncbi:MAG: MFS transporter [Bacteroidales bacterium]|nr:MFS transporter [Bacteroidales bacterium]
MEERVLKRSVLWVATFSAFLTPFMGAAVNLALPAIGKDLDANAIQLNWVVTIYLLSTAVFILPAGRMGDIVGRKRVFITGLTLFTATTFAIIFSPSINIFLMLRALQGVSSAMIFGTSMAIITSVFPPGERGQALGINITAVYVGLSSGPFLGGLLTEYFGWRSIFTVLVPVGMGAILLTRLRIKAEWAEARNEKLDIPGSLLAGAGLILLISGFSKIPGINGAIMSLSGIVLLLAFFLWEKRATNPLLDLRLLASNRVFSFSNLAALIHYAATSAIAFFLSLYLQYLKGLDPRTAGLILMTQPVMMAIFSIPAGRLSDRTDPGRIASTGIALTSAGILLLTFIRTDTSLAYIIAVLALIGVGYALFSSPNSNAIMSSVEKKHLGVASGMLGTMRMIGQTMSLGVAMILMALFLGSEKITPANYPELLETIRTGLIIFALLCISAIFASLARNGKRVRTK